jgi:putative transposase
VSRESLPTPSRSSDGWPHTRTWGAERIRGERLKLGIRVAKRTTQRHIVAVRPRGDGQKWRSFLRNHTVWACDFLQVHDLWFRPLFAFFVIDVNSKQVVHVAVTREPSEGWVAQQLRNASPFGKGSKFIIGDRDAKFGVDFDRVAKGAGIRVLKTAVRAPLMNGVWHALIRVSPSRFPFHGTASRRPEAVPWSPSRCSVACIMTTG